MLESQFHFCSCKMITATAWLLAQKPSSTRSGAPVGQLFAKPGGDSSCSSDKAAAGDSRQISDAAPCQY